MENYEQLLERFQAALDEFNGFAGKDGKVSIARGIAIYEENVDLTVNEVFKRADDAMYQNKIAMKRKEDTEKEESGRVV